MREREGEGEGEQTVAAVVVVVDWERGGETTMVDEDVASVVTRTHVCVCVWRYVTVSYLDRLGPSGCRVGMGGCKKAGVKPARGESPPPLPGRKMPQI